MGLASKACERGLQSRATVTFASVLRQRVTGRAELYQVAMQRPADFHAAKQ